MATSQKLEEHFLTCTICTDVFDNPCTLVCYHTFCRKCVINYTKTKPEAISAKSLLCPFCSKMRKVFDPDRPVEEWADDVKPSFVIQGLLDSFGPGSRDTTKSTWCQAEGDTTAASVWCSVCDESMCDRCARMNKHLPFTRHHDVLDLSSEVKIPRKRQVMCSEHKDEYIKFLCKDCRKVTCQTCCIIYHRKCESVVTLESELPALKSKLMDEKENLLQKQILMEKKVGTVKSKVIIEKDRYVQMKSKIKSSGQNSRETITLKENNLLDKLKEMSGRHIEEMTAISKSAEISVQMYRQQAELMDHTLQSLCDMEVYEIYQGCDACAVEDFGHTAVKEKGRIGKITFREDSDKLSRALDDLQLGEIGILYGGVLDLAATPVLHDTINITVAGDKEKAKPVDVTTLMIHDTHTVVTTDNSNMRVKSFYTRDNQSCHRNLSLVSGPWGLTKLQDNQLAVTVMNKTIITVEVNPDLVMLSTIKTNKQYFGITSLTPSQLAAGSRFPPCVDILDMTGNVLRSVRSLCSDKSPAKTFLSLHHKNGKHSCVRLWISLCLVPDTQR